MTKPDHGTVNTTLLSVKEKLSSTIGSLEGRDPKEIVVDNNDNDTDNDNHTSERITSVNISEKNQEEKKCYQLRDNYHQQSKSSLSADTTAEEFDEINWDTRKDSAVCLDDTEELDQLKERLLVQKVIRSDSSSRNSSPDNTTTSCSRLPLSFLNNQRIPAVYATCKNSEELSEVLKDSVINNLSLAKYYRPRRESSGYSSNLSTFDEDRRNSTTIETFQGFNSVAQRERRRSSTAKRFNLNRFASTKEEESERMPTSEVIYRKVSTAGLIEMPDIKELKEISEDAKCSSPDDELVCLSTAGLDILTAKKLDDKESLKKTSIYNKDYETDITKDDVLVNDTQDCANAFAIVTERSDKKNIQEIRGIFGHTSLSTDSYKEISTEVSKDTCQSSYRDDSLNILSGTRDSKLIKNYQETCCQKRDEKCNSEFENPVPENSSALKLDEKTDAKVSSISKVTSRSQSCNIVDESLRKPLKGLTSSPNSSPKSSRHRSRIIHQYSSPLSSTMELESISEKPQDDSYAGKNLTVVVDNDDDDQDDDEGDNVCDDDDRDVFVARRRANRIKKLNETEQLDTKRLFPRSVKVYQLLSTQSEDREDGEPRFMDRRTSLQINRHDVEEETIPRTALGIPDDKKLLHASSVPVIKIPGPVEETCKETDSLKIGRLSPVGRLSSTAVNVNQKPGDSGAVGIRPIYPYCPYSPYGSPQGSPRIRRRPLRESRRVSIDNKQGALQLNQYKLLDNIGQVRFIFYYFKFISLLFFSIKKL